ncbi:MAG: hypothetical protein AAGJ93_04485 [Bacteroidota bacterium]
MPLTITQDLLQGYTADEKVLEELRAYTQNAFLAPEGSSIAGELKDEPQVATWEAYVAAAEEYGVYQTLRKYLVQFQFPISAGISESVDYKNATRRGQSTTLISTATGLELEAPDTLELFLYSSIAGRIPVIVTHTREDFKSIVRALCYRNEIQELPDSMGAILIRGLNNWDRVRRVKQAATMGQITGDWRKQRSLYQDSLIVLSRIPYSNVPASAMHLSTEEWLNQSLQIRLAHECAHYFTLRHYGCMSVNMHDELIADYMGICAVQPSFRADWFLRFIGLENYPDCRVNGRIHNYLGKPPLSAVASKILQSLLYKAAQNVAIFDEQVATTEDPQHLRRLQTLCSLNLVEMATPNGVGRLFDVYHKISTVV